VPHCLGDTKNRRAVVFSLNEHDDVGKEALAHPGRHRCLQPWQQCGFRESFSDFAVCLPENIRHLREARADDSRGLGLARNGCVLAPKASLVDSVQTDE